MHLRLTECSLHKSPCELHAGHSSWEVDEAGCHLKAVSEQPSEVPGAGLHPFNTISIVRVALCGMDWPLSEEGLALGSEEYRQLRSLKAASRSLE
jgi:hypothetical protein